MIDNLVPVFIAVVAVLGGALAAREWAAGRHGWAGALAVAALISAGHAVLP